MNIYNKIVTQILILVFTFSLVSCATDEHGHSRDLTDAERGALIGAGIGALIGLTAKNKNKGVVIGAVGGALAGGLVGNYMDNQKQDLEKVLKDDVNSGSIIITKLPKDQIMIRMTSATAFDVNSSQIKFGFHRTLNKLSVILNKYEKTELIIVGHTDSTGSDSYNQKLSERRANAVVLYLDNKKVIPERLNGYGKGETNPISNNNTSEGRTANRRIEIYVIPLIKEENS
jgi:outer membrane protein OmpA-like peptidoglycan-associated protein